MKQKMKQIQKQEQKKVYMARVGSPFKQKDAQEIGEFIENCEDKSTRGILKEIKKNPKHKIYSLFEWDKSKAIELYQLQRVREIISHIELNIISIGDREPVSLNISVSAFKSILPQYETGMLEGERIYVPIKEGIENEVYRKQIIERAKTELRNWAIRYEQYQELQTITKTIHKLL